MPKPPAVPHLSGNDGLFPRFNNQLHGERDLDTKDLTGIIVASVPPSARDDPDALRSYLTGSGVRAAISAMVERGIDAADADLAEADSALQAAKCANDELSVIAKERAALPDQPVTSAAGVLTARANRENLAADQRVAQERALGGDREHMYSGGAGIIGWVLAVLIAIFETGITVRVFGFDPTRLSWGSLTWVAVTAALILFNHFLIKAAGTRQRDYREIRKANEQINRRAFDGIHQQHLEGTR